MDKKFWTEVYKNKFESPAGHTPTELTHELFTYLGSTDPELRDDIAYTVYANWLKQERYAPDELRAHADELLANLNQGLGETESDSIFLRAFSILFLAEIVHNDNKRNFFEKSDIQAIFEKGTAYILAEQDPRGYIHGKGWAHALAHTADLLLVLAKNRHIESAALSKILNVISEKIFQATNYIYIHGEDERLAGAVNQVLQRELISTEDLKRWLISFVDRDWKDAYTNSEKNRAFQNTRNLLRSIYLELKNEDIETHRRAEYELLCLEVLKNLKPY